MIVYYNIMGGDGQKRGEVHVLSFIIYINLLENILQIFFSY